jgi:sigma-B regulation protein RsbU (phosphoserine phosphatase)
LPEKSAGLTEVAKLRRENRELRARLSKLEFLAGLADRLEAGDPLDKLLVRQERHERELQFAHTLQQAFLPPAPPRMEGLRAAARYLPAREVGGDFYDFMPISSGSTGVLIGDVAGKGVPAAMLMARFSSTFRSLAMSGLSPGELMSRANAAVCERSRRGLFVTAIYMTFEAASDRVVLCNAGHPVPLLRAADGNVEGLAEGIDVPLGVVPETQYAEACVELPPGGNLVLMTDGAFDAKAPEGGRYGLDRLRATIAEAPDAPGELVDELLNDIIRFTGAGAQSDDMTVVAMRRDGRS